MDEVSKMYDDQTQKLLSMIDKYLEEMDKITAEIREKRDLYNTGNYVNYKEFASRQHDLKILNKKIKECVSTIAFLSGKIEYEEADFTDDVNMVRFRAEVTQNTIPKSIVKGNGLNFDVTTRNVGFSNWDKDTAYLEVHLYKSDLDIDQKYKFYLDVNEIIMLGQSRTFHVLIPALSATGVYNIDIYMANLAYNFDRVYSYQLYVM